jgi:hypothetical protein
LVHEVGHHVFTVGNNGTRLDPQGPAAQIASQAFRHPGKNTLSDYAKRNEHEYFSECFSMYIFDRNSLQTYDPVGFDMVESVLRLPSVAILPTVP